jgi:hypothetical protein
VGVLTNLDGSESGSVGVGRLQVNKSKVGMDKDRILNIVLSLVEGIYSHLFL